MNKYEFANKELKAATDAGFFKTFVKTNQRGLVECILNECIPNGFTAITIPWRNSDGEYDYWYFPLRKKSESERGYHSRLMSWALLYIAENFTHRMNDEDMEICGFLMPEDVPDFYWEGI